MSTLPALPQQHRKLLTCVLEATLLQSLIAALSPLFSLGLKTSALALFGAAIGPGTIFRDVLLYFGYADAAMAGKMPYRAYLIEYPILSFPFMLVPRFFGAGKLSYTVAFVVEMLLINALAVYLVARLVEMRAGLEQVPSRLTWYTHFFFALSPFIVARFDLVPMALSVAAVYAWFSGRNVSGGILTGAGALVKFFPAVLAGPGLVWEASRSRLLRWRGTWAFLLTVGLGMAVWFAFGRAGAWDSLEYHLGRGLELKSLYAGVLMSLAKLTGAQIRGQLAHGSLEIITPGSGAALALAFPLQAAALLLVLWRFYRSGMRDPIRYCGAAVLAFIIFGKAFSSHFMIWLIPFVVLLEGSTGRRARPLFLACCLGTTAIFPWAAARLYMFAPFAIALLNARNLLLLVLLGVLLFGSDSSVDCPKAAVGHSGTS